MTETTTGGATAPTVGGTPRSGLPAGPLTWQRTDVVGTELVLGSTDATPGSGTAVVHGSLPHVLEWIADDTQVTVTAKGGGWSRTLQLRRNADGWTCHTTETGDAGLPAPGTAEPIDPDVVLRIADSPIFVTWAVRRLGLTTESGPVTVPSARVLVPSLTVVTGTTTYHLVSPNRLRVTGDGPAAVFELDRSGIVAYQAGRLRLAR